MDAVKMAIASIEELQAVIQQTDPLQVEALKKQILAAKRIFIAASGRSLLAMKFFAMRLMQLGFTTYLVGEVCTPSIQPLDLLIIGSGSGETKGMLAIAQKAKALNVGVAIITKNEKSSIAKFADSILKLNSSPPIQEGAAEAKDQNLEVYQSIRPSGNPFEQAIVVISDAIICSLMVDLARGTAFIAHNHANLE